MRAETFSYRDELVRVGRTLGLGGEGCETCRAVLDGMMGHVCWELCWDGETFELLAWKVFNDIRSGAVDAAVDDPLWDCRVALPAGIGRREGVAS